MDKQTFDESKVNRDPNGQFAHKASIPPATPRDSAGNGGRPTVCGVNLDPGEWTSRQIDDVFPNLYASLEGKDREEVAALFEQTMADNDVQDPDDVPDDLDWTAVDTWNLWHDEDEEKKWKPKGYDGEVWRAEYDTWDPSTCHMRRPVLRRTETPDGEFDIVPVDDAEPATRVRVDEDTAGRLRTLAAKSMGTEQYGGLTVEEWHEINDMDHDVLRTRTIRHACGHVIDHETMSACQKHFRMSQDCPDCKARKAWA